jgi:hypothetical protein
VIGLLLMGHVWAAEVLLQAETTRLQEGQTVGVQITVVDGEPRSRPVLSVPRGLTATFGGNRTSQTLTSTGRRTTRTFSWNVTALAAGTFQLGPVRVRTKNRVLDSNTLTLQVAPRSSGPGQEGATATLGEGAIWAGQTVMYRVAFRTPRELGGIQWSPPELAGFMAAPGVEPKEQSYVLEEQGRRWTVVEVDTPYMATGAGVRKVPAGIMTGRLAAAGQGNRRILWTGRNETFMTRPMEVEVKSLPVEGQPEGFQGLVGTFQVRASLSDGSVALGESVTMTVEIVGNGSLAGLKLPPVEEGLGFRVYDDQPEIQAAVQDGKFLSKATLRRAVVPEQEGLLALPAVSFVIFDPAVESWRQIQTAPTVLEVKPGEGAAALSSFGGRHATGVDSLAEDILPIHPRARLTSQAFSPGQPRWLGVLGLPWLGWVGLVVLGWVQRRAPSRRHVLRERLKSLSDGDLSGLEGALREGLGVALGRSAAGIEGKALEEIPGALGEDARSLYRTLERARYGAATEAGLAQRVRDVVRRLLGAA